MESSFVHRGRWDGRFPRRSDHRSLFSRWLGPLSGSGTKDFQANGAGVEGVSETDYQKEAERFDRYWDMFRADYPEHVEKGVEFLIGLLCTIVVSTADDPHHSLSECSKLILQT